MFDQIAGRYDLLNRIMSLGQDQRWRRRAVQELRVKPGDLILDVATGTADLAMMIADRHPSARVLGVDPSANMLAEGNKKILDQRMPHRVTLELGDGQALPLEDDSVDGAVVAFGIRNFPDRLKGLQEMRRVVRPGRRVVILELSEPRHGLLAKPAQWYVHEIVPRLGALISGQQEYRYLQQSIEAFPDAPQFLSLMAHAGLHNNRAIPMTFGAVHVFVGEV
jgi:demethylmenaquinone methyltransferase/2-methoxy-6-polyprenyl-1,4-benzoquinol methylase